MEGKVVVLVVYYLVVTCCPKLSRKRKRNNKDAEANIQGQEDKPLGILIREYPKNFWDKRNTEKGKLPR